MNGLMMNMPLLIKNIAHHAERLHGDREIVSITADGAKHRYTFKDSMMRARKVSTTLDNLGISKFGRVGTLAWNSYKHLELYYGVSCSERVLHTINPRLFEEQLVYIINHAADEVIFFEAMFSNLVSKLILQCPNVRYLVCLDKFDQNNGRQLDQAMDYEMLINDSEEGLWEDFSEETASGLCYTSGTTGNPKGVLYSHRSTVLHSYAVCLPDSAALSAVDSVLTVVPMFHVNAWGYPYAALMAGSKLVFPGHLLGDPKTLVDLIESEDITIAGGVPTVWHGLLSYLKQNKKKLDSLNRTVIGGSACPPSMIKEFREVHDVRVLHGWGMTEMSPIGLINQDKDKTKNLSGDAFLSQALKQGRPIPGVEIKIIDENGNDLPWNGIDVGNLLVRGPWVCRSYYEEDVEASFDNGWFDTGDIASVDTNGYVLITDRAKDIIKSGGEWISSIELENIANSHPDIEQSAVIGVHHPKWEERPILVAVRKKGAIKNLEKELLDWFQNKVAKWWIPDKVIFIEQLPLTATGKVSKLALRAKYSQANEIL